MPLALPLGTTTSLLNIRSAEASLLDGVFLVIEQSVNPAAKLMLADSSGHSIVLGAINARIPALTLFEKTIDGFSLTYWDNLILNLDSLEKTHGVRLDNHVTLSLDNRILLQGDVTPFEPELVMHPAADIGLARAVAYGEGYADWHKAPESLDLCAYTAGSEHCFRIGTTTVMHRQMPIVNGSMAAVICKSGIDISITKPAMCAH